MILAARDAFHHWAQGPAAAAAEAGSMHLSDALSQACPRYHLTLAAPSVRWRRSPDWVTTRLLSLGSQVVYHVRSISVFTQASRSVQLNLCHIIHWSLHVVAPAAPHSLFLRNHSSHSGVRWQTWPWHAVVGHTNSRWLSHSVVFWKTSALSFLAKSSRDFLFLSPSLSLDRTSVSSHQLLVSPLERFSSKHELVSVM